MEFINRLSNVEVQESGQFKLYYPIFINGDLLLSIQASYYHYCNPRKTLSNLSDYATMEFALMRGEERDFVNVSEVLPNFSRLEEINKHFEGQVYGYVPVDLINDLYKELTA